MQPDFMPPVTTARTIFEAYPDFRALLNVALEDSLGILTWPAIIAATQSVVSGMTSL